MITSFKIKSIIKNANAQIPKEIWKSIREEGFKKEYLPYFNKYLEKIEEALRIDPKSKKVLEDKFYVIAECDKYKECIDLGEFIIENFQNNKFLIFQAYLILGKCFYKINDNAKAKNYLEKVIDYPISRENGVEYRLQEEARSLIEKINN